MLVIALWSRKADCSLSRGHSSGKILPLHSHTDFFKVQLHIHPSTAKEQGIEEGERVVIETPKGSIQHVAKLMEDIHLQVVNGVFGWWLLEKETLENGYLETNVNAIVSYKPPYDSEVGINRVQGVQCQVRKLYR
jgi:thiosulfate reductase/polysulfide reductase chain A